MTGTTPYAGYVFVYFRGNSPEGEQLCFAASEGNDALRWRVLNGGRPLVKSAHGTGGLRDPFLIRSPEADRFYLLATDLSIGSGTSWDESQRRGSRGIEVWESSDLVHWSEQRHVVIAPENAGNAWAPEAVFDRELGRYVVFWASKLYGPEDPRREADTHNVMLCATTRDFAEFGPPALWQDPGQSVIDSTVLEDGGEYFRFTKQEAGHLQGWPDVVQERASRLTAPSPSTAWASVTAGIGRGAGLGRVEGPIVFAANPGDVNGPGFYLFLDEYEGRGYVPLASPSLRRPDWRVPQQFALPGGARHGCVIPVTAAELAGLHALA